MFNFLSYGVLIISKTKQGAEKTAGIARLEWGTQIPILHFSFRRLTRRGPVAFGEDFGGDFRWDASPLQLLPEYRRPAFSLFPGEVFGVPPVIQKFPGQQLFDDPARYFTELRFQLPAQSRHGVVAVPEKFQCMRIDVSGDFHLSRYNLLSYGLVWKLLIVALVPLVASSCGYRLANKKLNNGEGQTIAVPAFTNRTTTYRIEQRLTEAVRRELIRRTRFNVSPEPAGDLVMAGEVLSYTAVPIIFNEQGRGSSYSILVDLYIRLTDAKTGAVLFQNDRWTFREVFELAQNSSEFVPEDSAALDRLARRFAASLVASVMRSK